MAFLAEFIQTIVKAILFMAVAVGAIFAGKAVRDKKDAKAAATEENV